MRYRWDPVYPAYGRRPEPADDRNLRVSDAERGDVADALSRHFADGRLDQTEFKVRLDRAMAAVTRGDLAGLFHDLPRLPEDPEPPRSRRRVLAPVVVVLVAAVLVSSAVGSTVGYLHLPWLVVLMAGLLVWRRTHRHRTGSPPRGGAAR